MAESKKAVDAVDVWRDGLGLIRACGPCGRGWIMSELVTQTAGVTKENAGHWADLFIRQALERKVIEVYDPEETPNTYVVATPRQLAARHVR